jgi:DNA (cytosine-5)-methyltransferase 1
MAHVDLCSGIGGFALGFEWAGLSKPVLFCDIEPWSRKILKKHWPDVPIAEDVKELADDPDRYVPRLDWSNTIVSGGYPCQAFSVAGKQKGWEDPRAIWPWLHKIVALKRPKFAVFENVTGHIALGLDKVIHDLEGENYSIATLIIPASAVGAPHKRERLWIVAHSNSNSQSDATKHEQERLVGNTKHNGSSTSTIKDGNQENARRSTEGKIEAKQSERASGQGHNEYVPNTNSERLERSEKGGNTKERWENSEELPTRRSSEQSVADTASKGLEGSIRQISERSRNGSSNESKDVADTNDARNRASEHETEQDRQTADKGRQEQPQSEFSRQRNKVADTESERHRGGSSEERGDEQRIVFSQEQGRSSVGSEAEGRSSSHGADVADTDSKRGCSWNTEGQDAEDARQSSRSQGQNTRRMAEGQPQPKMGRMADGLSKGLDRFGRHDGFEVEPADIPRVATGIKNRVQRLKGLGNAIVPQIAMQIGLAIKESQWK